MKKVLFIGKYGVSLNVYMAELELIKGLSKKGVDITVLSHFSDEYRKLFDKSGIKMVETKIPAKIDRNFINLVQELYEQNEYDIIHCYHNTFLRNVILAVKNYPVKLVTYLGLNSVHWHDPLAYMTFLNKRVDTVICNSKYVLNHLKKQLWGKRKEKAVLIYKGYDLKWFDDVPDFDFTSIGIPKNSLVVSLAGVYMKRKGMNYLIDSAKYLPKDISVHFVLIGRQTDSDIVKNMVAASHFSDRFHLLGYRKDVRSLIKSSDIYVQSSLQEGFGRALSEAASLATPVVCTDTGGFIELVSHKKSGMIIPIKDAKKIAESIEYLAYDKNLRVKMGKAAQNAIKENFNIQTTIEETYKLYTKLID